MWDFLNVSDAPDFFSTWCINNRIHATGKSRTPKKQKPVVQVATTVTTHVTENIASWGIILSSLASLQQLSTKKIPFVSEDVLTYFFFQSPLQFFHVSQLEYLHQLPLKEHSSISNRSQVTIKILVISLFITFYKQDSCLYSVLPTNRLPQFGRNSATLMSWLLYSMLVREDILAVWKLGWGLPQPICILSPRLLTLQWSLIRIMQARFLTMSMSPEIRSMQVTLYQSLNNVICF